MGNISANKPRGYGALMGASFRLYRVSFKHIFLMSFVMAFILFIPRLISDLFGEDIFILLPLFDINRLWLLLTDVGALLFFIAILWHMHCELVNKQEPLIDDLEMGAKKFIFAAIATMIASLLGLAAFLLIYSVQLYHHHMLPFAHMSAFSQVGIGFLLFFQGIVILYISILFLFITPLIATENCSILSAIAKSVLLAYKHPVRIFFLQITPWLIYTLVLSILSAFGVDIHLFLFDIGNHSLTGTIINLILFALYIPWIGALLLLQLHDLELRHINDMPEAAS